MIQKFVVPRRPTGGNGIVEGDMKYRILRDPAPGSEPPRPIPFTYSRFTKTRKLQCCLLLLAAIIAILLGILITWLLQWFLSSSNGSGSTTDTSEGIGFNGKRFTELSPVPYGLSFGQMSSNSSAFHQMEIKFKTASPCGLLLWQGLTQDTHHLAIAIVEGKAYFMWNQGNSYRDTTIIRSNKNVTDGLEHTLYVQRRGKLGSLSVDSGPDLHVSSKASSEALTPTGNIFVGGIPSPYPLVIDGWNIRGFVGCITQLSISRTDAMSAIRNRTDKQYHKCN